MSAAPETRLNNLVQQLIAKPRTDQNGEAAVAELDTLIESLKTTPNQWFARATVLRQSLEPVAEVNSKQTVLGVYEDLLAKNTTDAELHLEACRAFVVFEEAEKAETALAAALKLLNLDVTLRAVEIKPTKYQEKPALRLSCVTTGSTAGDAMQGGGESIEYVPLTSETQLDVPLFCSDEDKIRSTERLTDLAYVALLAQADISMIGRPLDQGSLCLPYVWRITESADFAKIHWAVQERALYERSLHESEDIEHLERGTLQLLKISESIHANNPDVENRLAYAFLLPPLSWRSVDEMAARRLVAMSDFANAVPFYERLNEPLETVMCYSAIGDNEKALKALQAPQLAGNAKAFMLRGDIEQDPAHWEQAWSLAKLPEAKLRLAQKAAGDENGQAVETHLDDLLELYPTNASALRLAGMSALGTQQWERAAELLKRSLAVNEDDSRSWSNLSTALVQLERPEQALVAIKQALRTDQNEEPDVRTVFNFVALSAQLTNFDDVVTGLSQLCALANKGSAQYVARVSGVLPRLVTHYVGEPFEASATQVRVATLFRDELPHVIPEDDAMLARLTGKVEFWTRRYWAGFAAYSTAVNAALGSASNGGVREWMRVKLYATEYAEYLERYGDEQGRIEGSKACADWKSKLLEAQRLVEESTRRVRGE